MTKEIKEKIKETTTAVNKKATKVKAKAAEKKSEKKSEKPKKKLLGISHEEMVLELAQAGVEPDKIIEILKTLKK